MAMKFVGETKKSYPYHHPGDGKIHSGKFEFYFDSKTGDIDVCHAGCNGTSFRGKAKGGNALFSVPEGYPATEVFAVEFKTLRSAQRKGR